MEKVFVKTGGRGVMVQEFKAAVPVYVVPGIKREYRNHGLRMYETIDGRKFDADAYDRNFKVTKGTILPNSRKGTILTKSR
jgi:hypothetical protein